MNNPSLERRWLQVAGLPLKPDAQAVRDELDKIGHVAVLPDSSRVILYAASPSGGIGPVIGALDLMPPHKAAIDLKVTQAELERPMETRVGGSDPERGDTIIRKIDASNPADMAKVKAALERPQMVYDPRHEQPPLDLPDYSPDGSEPERDHPRRGPSLGSADRPIRARHIAMAGALIFIIVALIVSDILLQVN